MTNSNLPRKKLNKSDCSFDPLVPAIAADCVHVPHIGELHSCYLYLEEKVNKADTYFNRAETELFCIRLKKYRNLGGNLF
jgi:hypothetical protein